MLLKHAESYQVKNRTISVRINLWQRDLILRSSNVPFETEHKSCWENETDDMKAEICLHDKENMRKKRDMEQRGPLLKHGSRNKELKIKWMPHHAICYNVFPCLILLFSSLNNSSLYTQIKRCVIIEGPCQASCHVKMFGIPQLLTKYSSSSPSIIWEHHCKWDQHVPRVTWLGHLPCPRAHRGHGSQEEHP